MKELASSVDQAKKLIDGIEPLVKLLLEFRENLQASLPTIVSTHEKVVAGEAQVQPPEPAKAHEPAKDNGPKTGKH